VNTRGFTLIELMMTMSLVAIMTSVAVPSFNGSLKKNRAVTQTNNLVLAFSLARSESVKRNIQVSVCSSTNQSTCASSTNWANGWIVFVDQNNNGTFEDDGDSNLCELGANNLPSEDCLLKTHPGLSGNPTMTGSSNNVQYQSDGAVVAAALFTHTPSSCIGNERHTINVTTIGRPYSSEVSCP